MIAPEVSGRILTVGAEDNQSVHQGDTIVAIDPQPYEIAVARARANVESVRTTIEELKARYRQVQAQLMAGSQLV